MAKGTFRVAATALALGAGMLSFATPAQAIITAPAPVSGAADSTIGQIAKKDLTVGYTVSSWKATGYAGTVAIRAKNVGTERYYGNFPVVQFKVEVKTASGPQGVDRNINPHWYNGAYVRDLGFNTETSTHTYMVTLSNAIAPGENSLIASFDFMDGNTSEGRLTNYIQVTQVGRVAGDTSTSNDQKVDSRSHTLTDGGKKNGGIF